MGDLTTTSAVSAYLTTLTLPNQPPLANAKVTKLSGGNANYLYLITPSHSGPNTTANPAALVLKHSQPFVSGAPEIALAIDRQGFEERALTVLPPLLLPATGPLRVVTAQLLHHDTEHTTLIFPNGGPTTLKGAYSSSMPIPILSIGTRLGNWLAKLHSLTRDTTVASQLIGDSGTARSIYRFSYMRLHTSLEEYGFDPSLGATVNDKYGALLATDDDCQCHGDFWPGNIVVADDVVDAFLDSSMSGQEGAGVVERPALTVVDWEMTRRGTGATDVGQFSAEAWLLDRFRGGKGLLRSFWMGYFSAASAFDAEEGPVAKGTKPAVNETEGKETNLIATILAVASSAFLGRMGVHMGTHLAFWPTRVKWGDHDDTLEIVNTGRESILAAMEGRHGEWLQLVLESAEKKSSIGGDGDGKGENRKEGWGAERVTWRNDERLV